VADDPWAAFNPQAAPQAAPQADPWSSFNPQAAPDQPSKRKGIDWAGIGNRLSQYPGIAAKGVVDSLTAIPRLYKDMAEGRVDINTPEGMKEAAPRALEGVAALTPMAPSSAAMRIGSKAVIPTAKELDASASAGYEALKNSGTVIKKDAVEGVNGAIKKALEGDNWYADTNAPQTYRTLDKMLGDKDATIGELRKARENLKKVGGDAEDRAAAAYAGRLMDDYFSQVPEHHVVSGDPAKDSALMKQAGSDYRGARRSDALVGQKLSDPSVLKKADMQAAASGTGMNYINNLRQKIKSVITSPTERSRYSEEELQALDQIVEGSNLQNSLRYASKLAPAGIVSAGGLKFLGAGDPSTALLLAAVGFGAHWGGNAITKRALEKVAEDIRAKTSLAKRTPPKQTVGMRPSAAATGAAAPVAADALEPPSDALAPPGDSLAPRSALPGPTMSDASPDPIRVGERYAMADLPPPPTGEFKPPADKIRPQPLSPKMEQQLRVIERARQGLNEAPEPHVPVKARKIAKMDNNTGSTGYHFLKDLRRTLNLDFGGKDDD